MTKNKSVRDYHPGLPVTGILVLLVGIIFLLENLGIISRTWSIIWPSIVIIIGVSLLYRHYTAR